MKNSQLNLYLSAKFWLVIGSILLTLAGCKPTSLPTIGRTSGDLPMSLLMVADDQCYRVLKHLYFEAPFAEGMSFNADDCLSPQRKVGSKTVEQLASMHVTVTYDGDFYIIKHGY